MVFHSILQNSKLNIVLDAIRATESKVCTISSLECFLTFMLDRYTFLWRYSEKGINTFEDTRYVWSYTIICYNYKISLLGIWTSLPLGTKIMKILDVMIENPKINVLFASVFSEI